MRSVDILAQAMPSAAELRNLRREHVKTLRALAKTAGVFVVPDGAARAKVQTMAEAVAASGAPDKVKADSAKAWAAYKSTCEDVGPAEDGASAPEGAPSNGDSFRLRGRSFLLTYNHGFFGKRFPDGSPAATTPAALWRAWREWKADKKQELHVEKSSSTLERSLHSKLDGRVHFHWKVNLKDALDNRTRAVFGFRGVLPDVQATSEASDRGHFYAWAPKAGTLYSGTNYQPFQEYRVQGKWLDDLWHDGKLPHQEYTALALRVRLGYSARKREVEQVMEDERESRVDKRVAQVGAELQKLKAPPREFPAVREWGGSFLQLDFRWKILVLWADSASGKSTFAEDLFEQPYTVTVEEAEHLDLRGFDWEKHDGIVLDNVNSFAQLRRWRAVLRGRNAKSKGGQSATGMYSYTQYLFSTAIVATVDLDAPDGALMGPGNPGETRALRAASVSLERSGFAAGTLDDAPHFSEATKEPLEISQSPTSPVKDPFHDLGTFGVSEEPLILGLGKRPPRMLARRRLAAGQPRDLWRPARRPALAASEARERRAALARRLLAERPPLGQRSALETMAARPNTESQCRRVLEEFAALCSRSFMPVQSLFMPQPGAPRPLPTAAELESHGVLVDTSEEGVIAAMLRISSQNYSGIPERISTGIPERIAEETECSPRSAVNLVC
ncbi:unnamed protein product [Prorocentrum cordatum]|uniref:Uncharacterized protein n=1 Tax=Prorocentrum cordatum TaxID=2364126 RepID=A0ABN9W543_9DINO|nr:unnamed protein product [Polarella glacialis]